MSSDKLTALYQDKCFYRKMTNLWWPIFGVGVLASVVNTWNWRTFVPSVVFTLVTFGIAITILVQLVRCIRKIRLLEKEAKEA